MILVITGFCHNRCYLSHVIGEFRNSATVIIVHIGQLHYRTYYERSTISLFLAY